MSGQISPRLRREVQRGYAQRRSIPRQSRGLGCGRIPPAAIATIQMNFQVELNSFRGPLDLLLFLVRKHEVEILEIPIAPITEQYLAISGSAA